MWGLEAKLSAQNKSECTVWLRNLCDGYYVYCADRLSHAGCVAIYVNKKLIRKIKTKYPSESQIQFLLLEISCKIKRKYCLYRLIRMIANESVVNTIAELSASYADIILEGDFNCNLLKEN